MTRLTAGKAREMLKHPPRGRSLTGKQKRFFRAVSHGGKPTRLGGKAGY